MSAIDFEAEARAYLVWAGITFSKTDVTTLALRFGGIAERVATVVGIERDAARRALAAEQAAHADTERQLRDALARERAELAARVADVARLETSSRVMREEFDRMCEALQKHVGGEGLGGEWYPDLVATVVEERNRLRSELRAARQDLDVAESRKSEAFRVLKNERDEARDWVRRLTAESRELTCAFCGVAYPPGTPASNHEALTAHVRICDRHPLRADLADAHKQVATLKACLAEARADAFDQAIAECDDESTRVPDYYQRESFQAGARRCAFRLRRLVAK